MGKLTWEQLRLIYEGQYGVTADEANKWISKELFSKNWLGTESKLGRMWEDIEVCISYGEFLVEVDKFKKKNKYTETAAIEVMHEQKHPAIKAFGSNARYGMFGMSSGKFRSRCSTWSNQLRELGFLHPKPESAFAKKRRFEALKRQEKKLQKLKLAIKKSTKK